MFVLAAGANNQQCCCHVRMCSWSWRKPLQTGKTCCPSVHQSFCLLVGKSPINTFSWGTNRKLIKPHDSWKNSSNIAFISQLFFRFFEQLLSENMVEVTPFIQLNCDSFCRTHFLLLSWSSGCCHGWFGSPALSWPAGLEWKKMQIPVNHILTGLCRYVSNCNSNHQSKKVTDRRALISVCTKLIEHYCIRLD